MTVPSPGRCAGAVVAMLLLAGACAAPSTPNVPGSASERASGDALIRRQLAELPLSFVENRGQIDGPVDYYVQGSDASVYLTPSGMTVALSDGERRSAVEMEPLGARVVPAEGLDRAEGIVSYFKGPRDEWKTGLPTYSRVAYRDLWPGIDLFYSGDASRLKYSFRVAPGADPDRIRLAWRGATDVSLNDRGQLEVRTPAGTFLDDAPVSFQRLGHRRTPVETAYDLAGDAYGFRLEGYDPGRPLVIDPAVLVHAGFIGGSGEDIGRGIAVDPTGAVYLTGRTDSAEATFPVTGGPGLTHNGGLDAFVAKVAPGGGSLSYAGYIGGSGLDSGDEIAVDPAGAAYVTGITGSTEATFPVTGGPDLTYNGGRDAFVAKVAPGGASLAYAGYIGGSQEDVGRGIAVDSTGAAYVTGATDSTEATFPVTGGPDLTHNGGFSEAFVARVAPGGGSLTYAGYIGGSGLDVANGIAVDPAGAAYVSGHTDSTEATFPVTGGPDLTLNGAFDAFVARVAPGGGSLTYAGYIGGSGDDGGNGIAVDPAGAAYVSGETASTTATFPATGGPDLSYNGGTLDAFVARVAPGGGSLSYAGYIGGSGEDAGIGIAVDPAGAAYLTGYTDSIEATFPVTGGPDLTYNGGTYDAFVAGVAPGGGSLAYAGYIGGSEEDFGVGIAVDAAGAAYVTGATDSTEATFPVTGGPNLTYNGGVYDAFVAKVAEPTSKTVSLRGKRKVRKGRVVKLTAVVSPCAGHEGDTVDLYRGEEKIQTAGSDAACTAVFKVKMKKTATFVAVSPQQDDDHLEGRSDPHKVKVKKRRR